MGTIFLFDDLDIAATCAMKKKELEDWVAKQPMKPLGLSIPECDSNGDYAGKQCSGSQYV